MNTTFLRRFQSACLVFITLCLAVASGQTNNWLNVRDSGASGSAFETIGSILAGSKQITVKNVGDFKVGQGVMVSRCNIRYVNPTL
ncbi:MAG: hypothetical protein FJ388_08215 [Verrucomicrobia bacterium]|nr:hypothetical protein [Verrucomicrobiota bacterium]